MPSRTLAAAALGAALALGSAIPFGPLGTAYAAASLSSITLKKSDVPAVFRLTSARADTAQSAAKNAQVSIATLRAKGWIGRYAVTYDRSNASTDAEVTGNASLYKSASGASWDIAHGLSIIKKQFPNAKTFSVSGIGQQALGVTASGTIQRINFSTVFVVFRRGSYVAAAGITLAGKFTATPSISQVEHYAAIMDGRIKKG